MEFISAALFVVSGILLAYSRRVVRERDYYNDALVRSLQRETEDLKASEEALELVDYLEERLANQIEVAELYKASCEKYQEEASVKEEYPNW